MNHLVIPNEGKNDLLRYQVKETVPGVNPWTLRLYANDLTPDAETVLSDVEEADWLGYAGVTMTRSVWTSPVLDTEDNFSKSTWGETPTEWTNDDVEATVYGCYYTDDDAGVIRGIFRFDTPITIPTGGSITVLPSFWYSTAEFTP